MSQRQNLPDRGKQACGEDEEADDEAMRVRWAAQTAKGVTEPGDVHKTCKLTTQGLFPFWVFVFLWVRATFPRYRYDQLMRLGWKVFLPISLVSVVIVSGFVVFF